MAELLQIFPELFLIQNRFEYGFTKLMNASAHAKPRILGRTKGLGRLDGLFFLLQLQEPLC